MSLPRTGREPVNANNRFAFDLYHALREKEDGNLFYSPFSVSLALAMTWAGAWGETEQQMAEILHFALPQGRLHPAFNALDWNWPGEARRPGAGTGRVSGCTSSTPSGDRRAHQFLPEFLETLARHYDAGLRLLDFAGNPEAARGVINDWVNRTNRGPHPGPAPARGHRHPDAPGFDQRHLLQRRVGSAV